MIMHYNLHPEIVFDPLKLAHYSLETSPPVLNVQPDVYHRLDFLPTARHTTTTTTTATVLRPFVRDYPGEPVPEETFTHPPS